jgi:23S rRNA pseudouridine2605 synthase
MEQRIQKVMSAAGICSRRHAEDMIISGKVFVNGSMAKIGDKADPEKDKILVNGRLLTLQKKAYYILNKPKEILVSKDDPSGKKTIYDLFSVKSLGEKLMHVGRLDFMTEGLLILTSDGDFANKIMHPRYENEKTYVVRFEPGITEKDAQRIRCGMKLDAEVITSPAKVKVINPNQIEITIHEGMNRVIRKMMEALGYKVFFLQRSRIGSITLGGLELGQVRELTEKEVSEIMNK